MEYEFREIEELVRKTLEQATSSKGKRWSFTKVRDTVNKKLDSVRTSFALKVLEQESEIQTRKYVRYHQLALTQLLSDIATPKQQSARGQHAEVRKFMVDTLETLFEYLLIHFRPHLNLDFPAPTPLADRMVMEMKECSTALDKIVQGVQAVEVANIFRTILLADCPITLRRIQFLDFVCGRLKANDLNSVDDKLYELLLAANFNEPTFLDHYTAVLAGKLSQCQTQAERREQIAFYIKMIAQLPTRHGLAYDPGESSIKEQLLDWLAQELTFEERRNGIGFSTAQKGLDVTTDFKLLLDLSVAQLALLVKSLVETSVIQNKSAADVLRFFAQYVKTKRSESISLESLRIKYYAPEESTKEMVKITLSNCIRYMASI